MSDIDTPDGGRRGIDRRALIKRAAATGAVAWTAPLILESLSSPAGAITAPSGCHSVQIAAGNCTTSVTPTATVAGCTPATWSTSPTAPCPAFAGGQNLAGTLCLSATTACATNTSPITFTISNACSCTFTAGIGETNASGANQCRVGTLSGGNKTISFTLSGGPSVVWIAFRLVVTCS
jgi:hypothetical protein